MKNLGNRWILLAATIVALNSCGGNSGMKMGDDEFAVMTVQKASSQQSTSYPATVKGLQDIEVRPQVSRNITKLYVDEGATVRKGQALFGIDPTQYAAAVHQAKAVVEMVRSSLNTASLSEYLSSIGFGALLGILKNYDLINPFVSATNDAFDRLKPGYEAPVCVVTSLGHSSNVPSRNRTVLVGLVREIDNPASTRFELRSPNPQSNTYLVIAASYMAMLDGIRAACKAGKTMEEADIDKKPKSKRRTSIHRRAKTLS